ncbi:aminobenzoyl-glutamate transport protein [Clostridium tetanomorphum]|uniref:AbgT family transporter n=1 Tax=Clostridium tetanomorphum TaxID=1553 RepID=UPI0004464FA2|nr:AbgT family transporter [Clostridium tetanomorphum]KAJ52936.1 aminobenzoyl-glutamate transport protein [Clostridium tetanomorphum DSM 665]MBP1864876.1 aminobenzoyl-glutamate transport protein [Clostridium tetanomorphum]NRS83082.1 aminobenzoyl-glutamate transport protein [Clostridium tetanomorphum]NRZ98821.1 aminobenzoyl-glutamate transport protein [Clostridium tetanomorphum]SQC01124.1 aminobenzoyl-glutamate transport protein [Clostridium tetanomorphum]
MNTSPQIEKKEKLNLFEKFLNKVEIVGNKMPDPVTIFLILSLIVMIISWIASGSTVINPSTNKVVAVVNLLSKDGMRTILMQCVTKFQEFPPLGMVLVVMLGAGVAEKSGLMTAAMKNSITKVPKSLVTGTLILVCILADGAGDAGFILLPPLAATVFLSMGRHPLVGMFAAYAGVAGGFSANLVVNMTDVLMASFTIPAAKMIDLNYKGTPAMNIYFMICSTAILVAGGVWVTEKIIAPRFEKSEFTFMDEEHGKICEKETKALKWSLVSILTMVILIITLSIGKDAFMADPKTGSLLAWESPLMQGLIPIITILFLVPGIIYGKITGTIKNDKDVIKMMGESMKDMGAYIVLAFAASLFIALFNWSNLGVVMSVKGANLLKNSGFTGIGVIIGFILLESIINIFVGSASAKWAIMAPVFVPMLLLLGYNPAVTQMAFRIGDSITNPISPLFPYFPILITFAQRYDKKAGMGTMISNMIPYSILFGILWTILLVVFIVFNIPLGPGGEVRYII